MTRMRSITVFILCLLDTTWAQNFYVAASAKLRLNTDETIAIALEDNDVVSVEVYVQDHPEKLKNITKTIFLVTPGDPELFKIRLDQGNFPPNFLNSSDFPKVVSVTAATNKFRKEILVPITTQSGYVFIQMDKPIYTPNQRALMRVISLNEDFLPSNINFTLHITNPDGIIVEKKDFSEKTPKRSWRLFETFVYRFSTYSVLGQWSATVHYGYKFQESTTVYFDLGEYVLPTFTVEVETADAIFPWSDTIKIRVAASHVYGESVKGVVTLGIGVKMNGSTITTFFAGPKQLVQGTYEFQINVDNFKNHKDIGWFPAIDGSQLVVEANVVDEAAGNNVKSIHTKSRFLRSPFIISFKRCLSAFNPGYISIIEADITYIDGKPAKNISINIKAKADVEPVSIPENSAVSDASGKVAFEIQSDIHHRIISATLETNDPRYGENQVVGSFTQRKVHSRNNAYISIARSVSRRFQPGDMFSKIIYVEPAEIRNIYYMIVSRGKTISMQKLPNGAFKIQSIRFKITHEMVPVFRLVVFGQYRDELIADSLKVDVERVCDPKAEVSIENVLNAREPGSENKINVHGTAGTWVGLLAVDESLYAVSKKNLLTKAKIFDALVNHDLGCGPGGGLTVNQVLGNAGIIIGTNHFTQSLDYMCEEGKRSKREADHDAENTFGGNKKNKGRAESSAEYMSDEFNTRKREAANDDGHVCLHGCGEFDNLEFVMPEEESNFEKETMVRTDFRETYIFHELGIGSEGKRVYYSSLPHSITTWIISAVSVSPKYGMCITEPQKLISFKKISLHLNLPYSVARNEQVEIQATIFNYLNRPLAATVYMYGVKYLCSETRAGQKSERKRLLINSHSSQSVSFPVVPLKAENFKIKVVVLTLEGSDIVEKNLRVVPEGITKELKFSIKLDPTNQQRRLWNIFRTNLYSDSIIASDNQQVTTVKLAIPEGSVPGTTRLSITAIGDQMTPFVETFISNPDALLKQPRGNGETNMVLLAQTLYAMRYLSATGKFTAERVSKCLIYIYNGFINQLSFKKHDGTYALYASSPTGTWLTAFVMKEFCEIKKLLPIGDDDHCRGVRWLISNQAPDGSFTENSPIYWSAIRGGVKGSIPMTAFVLIALEKCKCDAENLTVSKMRAVTYLEIILEDVNEPLPAAIVAYALALSNSKQKKAANDKFISMAKINEGENLMYWETENSTHDIEAAGYGLLTQLHFKDMTTSSYIVNWLNTKQLKSGHMDSIQDTIIALQSLSEYAIRSQMSPIDLVANMTLANDREFWKVLTINKYNADYLQEVKIDEVTDNDTLYINTTGHGVGSLTFKLRYNVIAALENTCKFEVTINFVELKENDEESAKATGDTVSIDISDEETAQPNVSLGNTASETDASIPQVKPKNNETICKIPLSPEHGSLHLIGGTKVNSIAAFSCDNGWELDGIPVSKCLNTGEWTSPPPKCLFVSRVKRQDKVKNSNFKYTISICVKYLGEKNAEMSVVDVGIFPGFEPDVTEIKKLEDDPKHLIQRHEKSSRGVVFYLLKVPIAETYCFSFPVIRKYIASNKQISVVKVYKYYSPDDICTKFYSPADYSSIIRTICEGQVCECGEVGCPSDKALTETAALDGLYERREKIKDMVCENYDYVWKVKLNSSPIKEGGFWRNNFIIEDVIKEGRERQNDTELESRTVLSRDNCAEFVPEVTYLIMGHDGQQYKNREENTLYHYILDERSVVYKWTSIRSAGDRELQRALTYMAKATKHEGCLL